MDRYERYGQREGGGGEGERGRKGGGDRLRERHTDRQNRYGMGSLHGNDLNTSANW